MGDRTFADEAAFFEAMRAQFADCIPFTYDTTGLSIYDATDLDAQIRALVGGYYLTLEAYTA